MKCALCSMTEHGTCETIRIDPEELDDARWFHRDQIVAMLADGLPRDALRMPPRMALAHQLAKRWIAGV